MLLKLSAVTFTSLCLLSFCACTGNGNSANEPVFKSIPELKEIKPMTPVKIKLKRNKQGKYSWDLSGDDPDKIIETDRMLKESLKK